jgi:hypothetical protein
LCVFFYCYWFLCQDFFIHVLILKFDIEWYLVLWLQTFCCKVWNAIFLKFFAALLFKVNYETSISVCPKYYSIFVFYVFEYFEICFFGLKNCILWCIYYKTKFTVSLITVCQIRRSHGNSSILFDYFVIFNWYYKNIKNSLFLWRLKICLEMLNVRHFSVFIYT